MREAQKTKVIPEAVVEAAWQEAAALTDSKALRNMDRLSSSQPALLAFVMARVEDLGEQGREIGVYMLMVLFGMFESHFGRLKKLDVRTVQQIADRSEAVEEEEGGEETQPFVMQFVADCLSDDDDDLELSEEDQETLFLTMKVVVQALGYRR